MEIEELLSLYHETVSSLGKGNHKISLIVDKMERFKVGFDDEKMWILSLVLNWSKLAVRLLLDAIKGVKLKAFVKFFLKFFALTLRTTSCFILSPSSCIGEYITKLVKINADKTM